MFTFKTANKEFKVSFFRTVKTIADLKKTGQLSHNHRTKSDNPSDEVVRQCVGAHIAIREEDGFKTVAWSLAICSPKDAFNLAKGRRIALMKAIGSNRVDNVIYARGASIPAPRLRLGPEITELLWDTYFKRCSDGLLDNGNRISATTSGSIARIKRAERAKRRANF